MKKLLSALVLIVILPATALAHPMGSKMYGHRMAVTLDPHNIKLSYVVEIPTSKLVLMMGRFKKKHGLDRLGPKEEKRFNEDMRDYLASNLKLEINGEDRDLMLDPNYAASQGEGDYRFFEYRINLISPIDDIEDDSFTFDVSNQNFRMQRAVFHNDIRHLPGAYAVDSNVSKNMGWSDDVRFRTISATFKKGEAPVHAEGQGIAPMGHGGSTRLLAMLRDQRLTFGVLLVAFLTAIFLGAVHALSPGHGKALVAAYLVGSRGTIAHAIWLAVIVTLTHIFSVVLVGVVALIAAQYVVPEYYMPFISLASGLIIVGIGVWLIIKRIRGRAVTAEHDHLHPHRDVSWKMLLTFGVTGGIVPCPSAMVVMLTAIAIGRIGFGLALIVFFSLGLTIALLIVGIIAIKASTFLDRFARTQALTRWLPLASAFVITVLGMAIIYQGFFREISAFGRVW
jgi:ABC-type nickel/cobalt efflux system permease component RcnA